MIRKVVMTIGFALLILLAVCRAQDTTAVDPCSAAVTTVEMQDCLKKQHDKFDAELNVVYKNLRAKLSDSRKLKLKEAQRAWIAFRDKSAEFEASEEEGGSMYNLVYLSVLVDMTESRLLKLRDVLKNINNK